MRIFFASVENLFLGILLDYNLRGPSNAGKTICHDKWMLSTSIHKITINWNIVSFELQL